MDLSLEDGIMRFVALFLYFFLVNFAIADENQAELMKVTPRSNPNCVEYFNYRGEMYCSTKATIKSEVDLSTLKNEKQTIVFDDRYWQAAWTKETPHITTIEYIPKGENIDNWHELITSQYIPGLQDKISPKHYAVMMIDNLKESGLVPQVKFFEDSPKQVIFEFRILTPDNLVQDELQKITVGSDGFYVLHYVIKQSDMGNTNRKKWLNNLGKSGIKGS